MSAAGADSQQAVNADDNIYTESCGPSRSAYVEQHDIVLRYLVAAFFTV